MDDYDDEDDEELVGTEEEAKNWRGIVISLVVIAFILAMIVTAIALITEAKKEFEPGEDFPFDLMIDPSLKLTQPVFQLSYGDRNSYITLKENSTGKFIALVDLSLPLDDEKSSTIIVPSSLFSSQLEGLTDASLSPDGHYILLKLQPDVNKKPSYRIYKPKDENLVEDSHFQNGTELDYASWIGDSHKLIYIKGRSIYYNADVAEEGLTEVSSSPQDTKVLNGLATPLYKDLLKREVLLWTSPDASKVVFAKIRQSQKRFKRSGDSSMISDREFVSLYVANLAADASEVELRAENITSSRLAYLSAVSWVGNDRVMTVWIDSQQQVVTYLLCTLNPASCVKNFVYQSLDLKWVDNYQAPVFNSDFSQFYTILPDPAKEKALYRHLATVKLDQSKRRDPEVTFLTGYHWSDDRIIGLVNGSIYYTSTGANFTHRHLYSYSLEGNSYKCLTCSLDLGTNCLYVDAKFGDTGKQVFLSCLGPDLPTYRVLSTEELNDGTINSYHQINMEENEKISATFEGIKLPILEYDTVSLDSGFDATIKFHIPAKLDREKLLTYGLVIILNDKPGWQGATEAYPDLFSTYLSKNQSYILADVDLRGSRNRGEKFQQSIYGALGLKESYDVQQIIRHIKERGEYFKVDETKIAVLGYGYGGFIALHTLKKDVVSCAITVSPLTDLRLMSSFDRQRYMDDDENKLKPTDLIYSCKKGEECNVPRQQNVLVIHGTEDEEIDYKNSLSLMRKLQLAGYEFKQQSYPEIGHDIRSSPVSKHFYQTITNYLKECFSGSLNHDGLINR